MSPNTNTASKYGSRVAPYYTRSQAAKERAEKAQEAPFKFTLHLKGYGTVVRVLPTPKGEAPLVKIKLEAPEEGDQKEQIARLVREASVQVMKVEEE